MKFFGTIPSLEKYKQYITLDVKGKDGVTRPITKVYYTKQCLECGLEMELDHYKQGHVVKIKESLVTKGKVIRWKCTTCNYAEREESERETLIREGHTDEFINEIFNND